MRGVEEEGKRGEDGPYGVDGGLSFSAFISLLKICLDV